MTDSIPVTVLSGPLGAGKTTVVNHLLNNSGGRSIAVLVNDMGEINVDAELLSAGTDLATDGGIAELSNGCICCELQDDLETEVARLASERNFEYLVVESSGISEPRPVAQLFTTASRAAAVYELDTMVTVVDTPQFVEIFGDDGQIGRETAPESEDRPLSDLLVEQIEFADVVLLNKCDRIEDAERETAEELIAAFTPRARCIPTTHGAVDPAEILGTGLFDPVDTGAGVDWSGAETGEHHSPEIEQSKGSHTDEHEHSHSRGDDGGEGHSHSYDDGHHGHDGGGDGRADGDDGGHDHSHAHPDEVYGVTSFAYRRRRPFHPSRVMDLFGNLPQEVVRSKGLFWVGGRDETAFLLSQAGPSTRIEAFGPWLASLPSVERDLYRSNRPDVEWHDDHGDRRTELVFIGQGIGEEALVAALDDCLVTDEEWERDIADGQLPAEGEEPLEFSSRGQDA